MIAIDKEDRSFIPKDATYFLYIHFFFPALVNKVLFKDGLVETIMYIVETALALEYMASQQRGLSVFGNLMLADKVLLLWLL